MKITYYQEADVLHIEFTDQPVAKTKTIGDNWTVMDLAENGTPIGVEIINAVKRGIDVKSVHITTITDDIISARQTARPKSEEVTSG